MKEKSVMFIVNVLKNIINVYFDTFFVFYFFQVANYEVIPLAKYYLTLYLFVGIGFFLVRNAMKKNIKAPFFRIGISLQAIYIAMIMLLKENIINYIYLVGFTKGIADGFFHFPKNILETEKISNSERQKFSGLVNTINKVSAIIVPLILGVTLTYMSYTDLGKIFFLLFIVMFIVSFYVDDEGYYGNKKMEIKKFINLLKENKKIRNSLLIPFLAGFTYSSGVMATIVTLSKINIFKTNLNLGFVDSICAVIFLIVCILYTAKIKKEKFKPIMYISGIICFITLIIFAFKPRKGVFFIMKRIVSKVDYDLQQMGQINPELALELWNKIKNKGFIIKQATEVVTDKSGKQIFFAPAICHMILSNPGDVRKGIYEKLRLDILKSSDLSRLTVFGNMSFLYLILLNGTMDFDNFYCSLVNMELKRKLTKDPMSLNYVLYNDIPSTGDTAMRISTGEIDISVSDSELQVFSEGSQFDIETRECAEEMASLMALAEDNLELSDSIKNTINIVNNQMLTSINFKRN